ncbi:ARHGB factor [Podarcis lilfordi]|uniref:ARHGB factor n=1 Tax=Podarcis lilfordi TaxID=74358 RepID=A0AA35LBZ7_9SAUR|nr:ARHGB factor [Podarcis lilfordi]
MRAACGKRRPAATSPVLFPHRRSSGKKPFMEDFGPGGSLRIVAVLFYQQLYKEKLLSQEDLTLVFPDLRELLKIHDASVTQSEVQQPDKQTIKDLMYRISKNLERLKEILRSATDEYSSKSDVALRQSSSALV